MALHLPLKRSGISGSILLLAFMFLQFGAAQAQTTNSWKGTVSTDWFNPANWSAGVVPGFTNNNHDVIIGDANFTGTNQPVIYHDVELSVKSLTVGDGTKATQFFLSCISFRVSGDVKIGGSGAVENNGTNTSYGGDFRVEDNGVYKETGYSAIPGLALGNTSSKMWPVTEFLGTGKRIRFPVSTTMGFSNLRISGSVVLESNVNLIEVFRFRRHNNKPDEQIGNNKPKLFVSGTLDPVGFRVSFPSGAPISDLTFNVEQSGTIFVKTENFDGNYSIFPTYLDPTGTVNYARSSTQFPSGNQNVLSSKAYGFLRISGNGVKTLNAPVSGVQTTVASNLFVDAGTFDIVNHSLNRTAAGGTLFLANNARLRLSGVSNFPANFSTVDLGPTSTTEYYGDDQNIRSVRYGHLDLTGPSTTIAAPVGVKTMESTVPMVVSGNLNVFNDASFTANNNIQVDGNVTISNDGSFNGGAGFTHTVGGNWTNNADFTGNTSTVRMIGTSKVIRRDQEITATKKNEFNNLEVAGLGTTINLLSTQTLAINGNLRTTGAGTLTQSQDKGSLTMHGTDKTISGSGILLNDFIANGSTTTTTSFTVFGNFITNSTKSFVATGGTITKTGAEKNIINNGTTTFFGLRIVAKTVTASSFNIDSDLSGNFLTATAGTISFRQSNPAPATPPTFAGTHNLFDVVVVTGSTRRMVTNSNLGIASTFAVNGVFDATTNVPNTVTYNGTIAQSVAPVTYYHLVFENSGGDKTATSNLSVRGDLTVKLNSNFYAGTNYTHTLNGNWINNGYSYASGSAFELKGTKNISITGSPLNSTQFKTLTIDKTAASVVSVDYDITTDNLNLTNGNITTLSNDPNPFGADPIEIHVLVDRSGSGWVQGTITRTLAGGYQAGVNYKFNAPFVEIAFLTVLGLNTVSVTSVPQSVSGFTTGVPINRLFKVRTSATTYTKPDFSVQYFESELNGNTEPIDEEGIKLFRSATGIGNWEGESKNSWNITDNWVKRSGLDNGIEHYWTLSDESLLYKWQGDVDMHWKNASNWRVIDAAGIEKDAVSPPSVSDIAELGSITPSDNSALLNNAQSTNFFQPHIEKEEKVKIMQYKSRAEITLTIASTSTTVGSLFVRGNMLPISAAAESPLKVHTINSGIHNLSIGNLRLDDIGQKININKTSGEIVVNSIIQKEGKIDLGAGILRIKGDYNFSGTSDKFQNTIAGTVSYEGLNSQVVANIPYSNLTIDKTGGIAKLSTGSNPIVAADLKVINGEMQLQSAVQGKLAIEGSLTVNLSGKLNSNNTDIDIKGNWTRVGEFLPGTGTVRLIGSANQVVSGSNFDNLEIGSTGLTSNSVETTGSTTINGTLTIKSGTLNLGDYTMNRSAVGGTFTMEGLTTILLNQSNFPINFNTTTLNATSTVIYQGTVLQNVAPVRYGNLETKNGGATAKRLSSAIEVVGNLKVNDGSTLDANEQTVTLRGHFTNLGNFIPGVYSSPTPPMGTLVLAPSGAAKEITGNPLTVNNMIVNVGAIYIVKSNITINGDFEIVGLGNVFTDATRTAFDFANNAYIDGTTIHVKMEGNFKNQGIMRTSGMAVFGGGRKQTIQLLAPIIPSSSGPPTVVFNGSVSPVLNSTATPQFATVVISNTEGVNTSVGWIIGGALKVTSGGIFNGGPYTHTIYTAIDNEGTLKSSGFLDFIPTFQGVYPIPGTPYFPLKFGKLPTAFESTGTLRIGGSEPVALVGVLPFTLKNLTISNKNSLGLPVQGTSVAPGLDLYGFGWSITGNMTIDEGALFKGGAIMVNPQTGSPDPVTYSFNNNLVNNGTLAAGDAKFIFKGTLSKISGKGTSTLGSLITTVGSNLSLEKNISIVDNLTHDGIIFAAPQSIVNFIGERNSVISAPASMSAIPKVPLSLSRFKVSKSSQTVAVNMKADLDKVRSVIVEKGILDLEVNQVIAHPNITETITAEDGSTTTVEVAVVTTLKADDGATIKVGGISTLPAADTTILNPNSNVVYYGQSQEVKNVQYGNLRLETDGDATTILKTFLPAEGTTKIAGNFTKTVTRSRVVAPRRIEYNGGNQEVAELDYNYLKLSTPSTTNVTKHFGPTQAGGGGTVTISKALTVGSNIIVEAKVYPGSTIGYIGDTAQVVHDMAYHHLNLAGTGNKTFKPNLVKSIGVSGNLVSTTSGIITTDKTTINFNGDGDQKVAAIDYDNLYVSVKGRKVIEGASNVLNVKNDLKLQFGVEILAVGDKIELVTGTKKIRLSPASGKMLESATAYITGTVETEKELSAESGKNFAGMGITITPTSGTLSNTKVTRVTGSPATAAGTSILRTYVVEPASNNADLGATVKMEYFDHELNGHTKGALIGYYSELYWPANEWKVYYGSANNDPESSITFNGIQRLGRYSAGSEVKPFPVELISFTALRSGKDAVLNWAVASEENNAGFEVEASADGRSFERIGFVKSKVGTSSARQEYSFTDTRRGKSGIVYYRLRQLDLDGKATFYGPRDMAFETAEVTMASAYPNPFSGEFSARLVTPQAVKATVKLYDAIGQQLTVKEEQLSAGENVLKFKTGANLPTGMYILSVEMAGQVHRLKLVKQ